MPMSISALIQEGLELLEDVYAADPKYQTPGARMRHHLRQAQQAYHRASNLDKRDYHKDRLARKYHSSAGIGDHSDRWEPSPDDKGHILNPRKRISDPEKLRKANLVARDRQELQFQSGSERGGGDVHRHIADKLSKQAKPDLKDKARRISSLRARLALS